MLHVFCAAGLALAAFAGCTPDEAPRGDGETSESAYPVVGGTVAGACSVPMNVKISGCTATLLTPTILVTAKHCGPKAGARVDFGEKAPFAFSVTTVKCVVAKDSDSAYCVLPDDERLRNVPVVPVLHGCEYTKFLKPGARILGAGFGQTKGTGPSRTKNIVEVPVARVRDPSIAVGDATHDLCYGDSGGGAFIHLVEGDKDWGWRLIGTVTGTAGGVMAPCGGTGYTSILRHIKLIEENEKIDITPCTDATGKWAPGPNCRDFLTDIKTGGGQWPACNPGPRTNIPIDSCAAGPGPVTPSDAGAVDPGKPMGGSGGRGGGGGMIGGAKPDASAETGASGGVAGTDPASSGGATGRGGGTGSGGQGGGTPGGAGSTGAGGGGPKGVDGNALGETPKSGSGFGCSMGDGVPSPGGLWWLVLINLFLVKRRRRCQANR
jgi:MYXO-CTERM domain-containing protein